MLYSILQIIAFQALFLLVYDLFLKRETFFNCNRAYLIITSVLALVLPFLKFPKLKTIATKDVVIHLPEVFIGTKSPTVYDIQIAEQAGIVLEQPSMPIWQIVAIMGIAIASLIFLIKITKLYWLKHRNPKRWHGNVLIVKLLKSSAAFSFFNTIFLGEKIPKTETPTIFQHELVHIKEYHTLDLLFFELLRIVFWFNPLVYIYQNRIKELHEFIADAKAVKQSGKAEYYTSLLNQVLDVNQVSFTNTFFKQSLIKKRIVMLQKTKSKQFNLIKYGLLIPMVFAMLIYTSTEVRAQQKFETQETVVDQELTDAELVKKYYEEFVAMKKNGSSFFEIADAAGINKDILLKYLPSRSEFLKSKAYMQYISDGIIKSKTKNGTLTQADFATADLMRMDKFKTYKEFKAFKNTKEAKQLWEKSTQDGILKLYVENFGNKTETEQKRYNALMKQLETDNNFKMLVVCDSSSRVIINSPDHSVKITEIEETIEFPFSVIEEVATLPECQDLPTNQERKKCMNMVINKHIGKNFNTSVADSLSPGKKRIFVQFKIDTDGNVIDIKARGPSVELEQEAKRVVGTLPQFVPGKQSGETVIMPFSIPIAFEVKGDDDTLKQEDDKVPFSQVEEIPIHPECTGISNKSDQKQCTTSAINKQVGKNFNTDLANSLGLPAGKKRIFVQFTISKEGQVTNIKARGPHPKLEEEAIRVIKLLPQLTPGKHNGNVVDVAYSLPIVFETVGAKKE
ncbi:beta-lactamase regulating signal transducer with metallopeptidase domain [Winogradskyella epiphytica]|uniref:Beta-lactamase regulating signal transducer with metallopeptidase domain n=1 Tax=Winogradskyella epiphytica TaxID=262005 RepID=A0A2V4WZX8_9FLAO|nr:M56 family metallopeptidase [Winogradskyella epiphytica]PYE82978.1 beta-lactamase regulating signal transducer with metallopeptidase domain [Winogradskyella epiphytica]GGW54954.1 hypothetical protein GCM10008085_02770 [Winogradskyella epiphytica]